MQLSESCPKVVRRLVRESQTILDSLQKNTYSKHESLSLPFKIISNKSFNSYREAKLRVTSRPNASPDSVWLQYPEFRRSFS
jgi:hypothetical protein